ncbi:MAG: sodium:proton antiporter, partial [Bacteroidales bacterium]|nr:sodium:proton antiporter [Bacteroidales bacterium]
WLLIVPVLTAVLIARKVPAIPVLAISTVMASVAALIFQPDIIHGIGADVVKEGSNAKAMFAGSVRTIYDSVSVKTGNADVDSLVASRGMLGMLNTIFLIICAMCFGASMKASGMLETIGRKLVSMAKGRTSLVGSTVVTGTFLNTVVSDQYLSIILSANLFSDVYKKEGFEGRLLSRAVEDSATVTSPLIPWSSCGMTQATILSVPTLTYLPFCFFNIISPLMSIFIAAIGYKVFRTPPAEGSGNEPDSVVTERTA